MQVKGQHGTYNRGQLWGAQNVYMCLGAGGSQVEMTLNIGVNPFSAGFGVGV